MRTLLKIALCLMLCAFTAHRASAQTDRWFVTSDGVRLHYIEAGRGPTLVFVPGWTMPAWIFSAQIAAFSQHYRVIAFDPRSQGASDIPATGYDQYRRGEDIGDLIKLIGPQPVVLIGWSLGVLDSLAYIHESGDSRIAGLVLIDNSVGEDPAPHGGGGGGASGARRPARPATREAFMRNFVAAMFRHPQPPAYIEQLTEACLRTPAPIARALLSYDVPRSYWKEAVYSTSKPVLYIVTPRLAGQAGNLAAHHPSAESVVLPDVGHAMFVDDPAQFDGIVQSFLIRRVWR
jgi:non-heme chloroperoxidase